MEDKKAIEKNYFMNQQAETFVAGLFYS